MERELSVDPPDQPEARPVQPPTALQEAEVSRDDSKLAEAARHVLAAEGRTFGLQPWQVAYCFALAEGREGVVPPGCGVGKGWLDARLREALADIGA